MKNMVKHYRQTGKVHICSIQENNAQFEILRKVKASGDIPDTYLLKVEGIGLRLGRKLMESERRKDFKYSDSLECGKDFFVLLGCP
jgi:hypothetical protein